MVSSQVGSKDWNQALLHLSKDQLLPKAATAAQSLRILQIYSQHFFIHKLPSPSQRLLGCRPLRLPLILALVEKFLISDERDYLIRDNHFQNVDAIVISPLLLVLLLPKSWVC